MKCKNCNGKGEYQGDCLGPYICADCSGSGEIKELKGLNLAHIMHDFNSHWKCQYCGSYYTKTEGDCPAGQWWTVCADCGKKI